VRGRFRKRGGDRFQHTVGIRKHVVVPKSKNTIAAFAKPAIAQYITRILCMLPAIDFDNEPPLTTSKIDNVRANRNLPDEFLAEQPRTKMIPKLQLGPR
jgi:hypothetical protein